MNARQVNAKRKREGLPPLNFKLFRAVIKKLEAAPMAYDQESVVEKDKEAPCGTAACIGGWAYLLSGKKVTKKVTMLNVLNEASELLGLNADALDWEDGDACRVFAVDPDETWPEPFASDWQSAEGREEQAAVAVRYLRNILATGDVNADEVA